MPEGGPLNIGIPGVLVGVSLLAWATPTSAASYDLAHPRVDPAWGGRPGMPTAPSEAEAADTELPTTLSGADRTAEYVRRMLASPATLDEAIRFHLYAPVQDIVTPAGLPPMGTETPAQARAVDEKARDAEPGLLAELDARFAALSTAVQRADGIVPPTPDATMGNTVLYCRFVYAAASIPRPGLGEHLWKRCIDDRDAFLDVLVGRMADLAVIPELPTTPDPTRPPPFQSEAPADLVLSPMVLPGETRAPLPFERLDAPFRRRLGERFEAAAPKLTASLQATLAHAAALDVYFTPAATCAAVLGPYAGPLARLQACARVSAPLPQACMGSAAQQTPAIMGKIGAEVAAGLHEEETRVEAADPGSARLDFTPASKCAALLEPHFPAVRGVVDRTPPPAVVGQACLDGAAHLGAVIVRRHLQAAIAASHPDTDSVQGWESRWWFAEPPGGTAWIDSWKAPAALTGFQSAYEAAMAPRRKEAVIRFTAGIQRAFAVDTGIEPEAAAAACERSERPAGDVLSAPFMNAGGVRPPSPGDALRDRPGLTAQEAGSWIETTCRDLHARTSARRRDLARDAGHVGDVIPRGLTLAIPAPSGELVAVDAANLVRAAATDMLQVAFVPGGMLSGTPRMTITPFGRSAPEMSGRLIGTIRAGDGKRFLKIDGLVGFPELDGPLATVACVAMEVEKANSQGRMRIFAAGTAAFFGDSFILAGMMEDEAQQDLLDVGACAAAKRAFLHGEASR